MWMDAPRHLRPLGGVLFALCASLALADPAPSEAGPDDTMARKRPALCEHLKTQDLTGYKVPGRKPDSQVPWELFLGHASHSLIAYIYGTRHPTNQVHYNKDTIERILRGAGLGDWSLLTEQQLELRPDITDLTAREVFEIKPSNAEGLQNGIQQLQTYLLALNQTVLPSEAFSAGKRFESEILIPIRSRSIHLASGMVHQHTRRHPISVDS